jgi:hypothetical protein
MNDTEIILSFTSKSLKLQSHDGSSAIGTANLHVVGSGARSILADFTLDVKAYYFDHEEISTVDPVRRHSLSVELA